MRAFAKFPTLLVAALVASAADAATFADLSGGPSGPSPYLAGPYAANPYLVSYGAANANPGPYAPAPYACPCTAPGPYGAPGPYSAVGPYGPAGPYAPPGPYGGPNPYGGQSPYGGAPQNYVGGPEGALPAPLDAPGSASLPAVTGSPNAYLPFAPAGELPHGYLQSASFGQVNSTTDPFNPWGLSTPFMFVPWSTPLSGWSNAETWNWWRERSGALPRNW